MSMFVCSNTCIYIDGGKGEREFAGAHSLASSRAKQAPLAGPPARYRRLDSTTLLQNAEAPYTLLSNHVFSSYILTDMCAITPASCVRMHTIHRLLYTLAFRCADPLCRDVLLGVTWIYEPPSILDHSKPPLTSIHTHPRVFNSLVSNILTYMFVIICFSRSDSPAQFNLLTISITIRRWVRSVSAIELKGGFDERKKIQSHVTR